MLIQMIGFIKLIEAKKLIAVNCYESTKLTIQLDQLFPIDK